MSIATMKCSLKKNSRASSITASIRSRGRFTAAARVARPAAYLLPPQYAPLAGLLRLQGVVVERLAAPWQGRVEAFTVDSLQAAPFVFEGHRTVTLSGGWAPRDAEIPSGWFYISTDQRAGVLAACLLEPSSEDGFGTWNYYDRELRRGAEAPVFRLRAPASVPRIGWERPAESAGLE